MGWDEGSKFPTAVPRLPSSPPPAAAAACGAAVAAAAMPEAVFGASRVVGAVVVVAGSVLAAWVGTQGVPRSLAKRCALV